LQCKRCTAQLEHEERQRAQAKTDSSSNDDTAASSAIAEETRQCAGSCQQILPQSAYNRNQWAKGNAKSRCRTCVEQSIQDDAARQQQSKDDKIQAAREKVEQLKLNKAATPQEIVSAESELAALEAEKVTGLKPVKMASSKGFRGQGRGQYGGRGRGRGRGVGGRS
jgi:hypothetical protein